MVTFSKKISLTDFCKSLIKKFKTTTKKVSLEQKPDEFVRVDLNDLPDVRAYNYSNSKDAEILRNRINNL